MPAAGVRLLLVCACWPAGHPCCCYLSCAAARARCCGRPWCNRYGRVGAGVSAGVQGIHAAAICPVQRHVPGAVAVRGATGEGTWVLVLQMRARRCWCWCLLLVCACCWLCSSALAGRACCFSCPPFLLQVWVHIQTQRFQLSKRRLCAHTPKKRAQKSEASACPCGMQAFQAAAGGSDGAPDVCGSLGLLMRVMWHCLHRWSLGGSLAEIMSSKGLRLPVVTLQVGEGGAREAHLLCQSNHSCHLQLVPRCCAHWPPSAAQSPSKGPPPLLWGSVASSAQPLFAVARLLHFAPTP